MRYRLLALGLAVLLGITACSDGGDDEAQDASSTTTEATDDGATEDESRLGRALGGTGVIATGGSDNGEEPAQPAEPSETYTPQQLPEPTESVIPVYEG